MDTNKVSEKVSFLDKLMGMKMSEFEFVDFTKNVGSPDPEKDMKRHVYYTLKLADPISRVTSSHNEYVPGSRQRVNDFRDDVTEVNVSLDHIQAYAHEFTFEEVDGRLTKRGSYSGDMFFDLSRSGKVWLTDTKLSQQSVDYKNTKNTERLLKLLGANKAS